MKRPSADDLTGAVEDYLKAIYDLERAEGAASTSMIAERLRVAPASVSAMVRRLAEQGLVGHEPYQGVSLTEEGRRAALRTLRRHRIIESYLVHALGYAWEEVHDEAERLEHAISDVLIERMAHAIGQPAVDPHGAPIPTREGTVDERSLRPLAELPIGEHARIARVADEDSALLRYLADQGLTPGVSVRVSERAPFGGPVTLQIGDTAIGTAPRVQIVGPELTQRVLVELSDKPK